MNRPTIVDSLDHGYIVVFNEDEPDKRIMVHVGADDIVKVSFPKSDNPDDRIWVTQTDDTVIINAF
jgi:hypothetical protein